MPPGAIVYSLDEKKGAPQKKDMRNEFGMGGISCCDYLFLKKDSVVLIEDTRLNSSVVKLKNDYRGCLQEAIKWLEQEGYLFLTNHTHLPESLKKFGEHSSSLDNNGGELGYVFESLWNEWMRKIYGTLLMLCRRMSKFPLPVQQMLAEKEYEFWLVATGKKDAPQSGVDYVKGGTVGLDSRLRDGALGSLVRGDIQIITRDRLREIFYPSETDPPLSLPDFGKDATM